MTAARLARRRGVGFLWFSLVALPFIFFAMTLSMDVTRLYLGARQVSNAADAAALAGAYQFVDAGIGRAELNIPLAQDAARDTLRASIDAGVTRSVVVTSVRVAATDTAVAVSVDYDVRPISPLSAIFTGLILDGSSTITRTAEVCIPGVTYATGGLCVRPQ